MKQEEKQQKFHEALLKMLYPPPPSPPPQVTTLSSLSLAVFLSPFDMNPWSFLIFVQADGDEEGKLKNSTDSSYYLPDEGELDDDNNNNRNSSSSSSDDDNGEKNGGSTKLTRSQRKRLRKRKFKEATSRRREIIGPLLPDSTDDCGADSVGVTLQSVRQNTASGSSTVTDNSGAPAFCTKKHKIKQRRKAKKLSC